MTRHRTWALVADAVHARILRNLEDGAAAPPQEILRKAEAPHLRRLLTDKSGRSLIAQLSRRGSALEQAADPVARDMQEFARDTLGLLGDHLHRGHLSRLAIFAAPRMLGALRRDMPGALEDGRGSGTKPESDPPVRGRAAAPRD